MTPESPDRLDSLHDEWKLGNRDVQWLIAVARAADELVKALVDNEIALSIPTLESLRRFQEVRHD